MFSAQLELDQPDAAAAGMRTVVDLYRRAQSDPIPLLEKVSRAVFDGQTFEWPLRSPGAEALLYQGLEARELLSLPPAPHDPDSAHRSRVELFAELLWGAIARSLIEEGTGR